MLAECRVACPVDKLASSQHETTQCLLDLELTKQHWAGTSVVWPCMFVRWASGVINTPLSRPLACWNILQGGRERGNKSGVLFTAGLSPVEKWNKPTHHPPTQYLSGSPRARKHTICMCALQHFVRWGRGSSAFQLESLDTFSVLFWTTAKMAILQREQLHNYTEQWHLHSLLIKYSKYSKTVSLLFLHQIIEQDKSTDKNL